MAKKIEVLKLLEERQRIEVREVQSQDGWYDDDGIRKGGLISFVRHFWDILEPGRVLVDGWPLWAMCEHLEAVTRGDITRLLINVPPGFMKALDCETPVLTTWGWKRHGDLDSDDFVYGPDGKPKRVLASTPHAVENCYRVTFDDGASIVAGAGHLWEVERDKAYDAPKWHRCRKRRIVTTPELISSVPFSKKSITRIWG